MRDTAHSALTNFLGLALTVTGAILTNASGLALIVPTIYFVCFIHSYFKWVDDESDEISDFIEEVERIFKENPPPVKESEKKILTQQDLDDAYQYGKKRRRRQRRR